MARGQTRRRRREPGRGDTAEAPPASLAAPIGPPDALTTEPADPLASATGSPSTAANARPDVRQRLATFATVTSEPVAAPPIGRTPVGPAPLRWPQHFWRALIRRADTRTQRPNYWSALLNGSASGLVIGIIVGLIGLYWQENDMLAGTLMTLVITLTSLARWWRSRSTALTAAHLGLILVVLWLLTPASRIIYQSDRDTGFRSQIYTTTANGGSTDRLSSSVTLESGARFSNAVRQIVLAHYQDGNTDIYVTDADGSRPRNLTRHPAEDRAPAWSPDGQEITFQSNRAGNWDVYVMNTDGSNLRKLTSSPADDEAPTWSPDGRTIVFQSDREGFSHIYTLGLRGAVLQLTQGFHHNGLPVWSPDGATIAFQSNRDGRWQLYAMRTDGGDQRRIAASLGNDTMPAWSPDGQRLVFTSDRDGNLELYTVHLDGSGLRRLTTTPTHESNPHWSGISPINWLSVQRQLMVWLGLLVPAWRPENPSGALITAPPAVRDEPLINLGRPLGPGEDQLPMATPRPLPPIPAGSVPQPTPTPGLRPVPTCAPGSFWC